MENKMTNEFIFTAQKRDKVGKGASRALRREGFVPATIYGNKEEPLSIFLNPKEILSQLPKSTFYSHIYKIDIAGLQEEVLVRKVQFHAVTDQPLHVDLLRIGENTVTRMHVPVILHNQHVSPGLKFGGILNFIAHSIEIACNPKVAPTQIDIDLATAKVGTVIKIEDIKLPQGVKTYLPHGYAIVSINASEEAEATTTTESN